MLAVLNWKPNWLPVKLPLKSALQNWVNWLPLSSPPSLAARQAVQFHQFARDVAEAITAAGVAVAKSEVRMGSVLRNTGEYEVVVQLHADVKATVQSRVVAL